MKRCGHTRPESTSINKTNKVQKKKKKIETQLQKKKENLNYKYLNPDMLKHPKSKTEFREIRVY